VTIWYDAASYHRISLFSFQSTESCCSYIASVSVLVLLHSPLNSVHLATRNKKRYLDVWSGLRSVIYIILLILGILGYLIFSEPLYDTGLSTIPFQDLS
jgi:hypothetical protein